jgi:hypothetical protein
MKQAAQKSKTLSLVPAETPAYDPEPEDRISALKESFDGWLNAVAPTLLKSSSSEERPSSADRWQKSLTFRDVTRVNQATVRQGTIHSHWPPDVVLSFLAAEVIKRRIEK